MNKVTAMNPRDLMTLTGTNVTTKTNTGDFKSLLNDVLQGSKTPSTAQEQQTPLADNGKPATNQSTGKTESPGTADAGKDSNPILTDGKPVQLDKDGKPVEVDKNGDPVVQEEKVDDMVQAITMGMAVQELAQQQTIDIAQDIEQAANPEMAAVAEQAAPVAASVQSRITRPVANIPATDTPSYGEVTQNDGAQQAATVQTDTQITQGAQVTQDVGTQNGGNDILSAETTITSPEQTGTASTQQQGSYTPQVDAGQQRFDDMISKAQQQLQTIVNQSATTATPEVTEDAAPDFILEQPAPLPGTPTDTESPAGVETAPESQTEVSLKPAPTRQATVQTPVEPAPTTQKPLKEMPKSDESVMGMQETQALQEPVQEPARTEAPQQPQSPAARTDQTEQIRVQITENLEKTKMEFNMQLQPEELGKINVRLVLEGGRLAVEIMAADPRSTQLLARQTEALAQSLRSSNLDVQSIQVVDSPQSLSSHMDGAFNMMNGEAQNGGTNDDGTAQSSSHRTRDGSQDGADLHQNGSNSAEAQPKTLLNYTI